MTSMPIKKCGHGQMLKFMCLFTISLLCRQAAGVVAVPCPKNADEWNKRREGMIYELVTNSLEGSLLSPYLVNEQLKACKMSSADIRLASTGPEKCMQRVSDMVNEILKPLVKNSDEKYTSVPKYLQDPKLLNWINHSQVNEALNYIRTVIAKKPGVPDLLAEVFESSVKSLNEPNKYRLIVKVTEPDGTLKWVNFTMPGPGQTPSKNISLITMAANKRSYAQDHNCYFSETSRSVECSLPKVKDKYCMACHVNGYISISPEKRMQELGVHDYPGRLQNIDNIQTGQWGEKGQYSFATEDGGKIDVNKLGPSLGLGDDLDSRRGSDFMRSCIEDIRKSNWPADQAVKPELDALIKNEELLKIHEDRIRKQMNCGSCHNSSEVGRLPYPVGYAKLPNDNLTSMHLSRIYDGTMPDTDSAKDLTAADRRVLASCLFKEQYGAPLSQPMNREQMKTGRFYQYMTQIDCSTGQPSTVHSNVFSKKIGTENLSVAPKVPGSR